MTPEDIQVLQKGLALAGLWIDEIPALNEEDYDPGICECWVKEYTHFEALVHRLSNPTPD